jgi:hypothetical protein
MKLLALALVPALALASPAPAEVVREEAKSFPASALRSINASLGVGEIEVTRGLDDSVRVVMTVGCKRWGGSCARRAQRLRFETRTVGSELRVKVERRSSCWGSGGLTTRLQIQVPASMRVETDLGVGTLRVRDVDGDVDGRIGVGTAAVRGREGAVSSVRLRVGVGDVVLRQGASRHEGAGFISQRLSWTDGPGHSRVALSIGVGEAEVALR